MDTFLTNLQYVKDYCDYIDIGQLHEVAGLSRVVEIETTRNGSYTLRIMKDEKLIYLHSKYDPEKEASIFVSGLGLRKDSIVILFGVGLGYAACEILEQLGINGRLIVIEPDMGVFSEVLKHIVLVDILKDGRVYWILGKTKFEVQALLRGYINPANLPKVKMAKSLAYIQAFRTEASELETIMAYIEDYSEIEKNTILTHGNTWQRNSLTNLYHLLDSVNGNDFFNQFTNIPAVIIGAGPSLHKNIDLLRSLQGKALLISTYTALRVIKNRGITPDIVVSIDANQAAFESKEEHNTALDVPVVFTEITDWRVLRKAKSGKIFALSKVDVFYQHLISELGLPVVPLESGGSVTCTALDFAVKSNCKTVIFVGQDLSHESNQRYISGTYHENRNSSSLKEKQLILVKDIHGQPLMTDVSMDLYRKWIERYISMDTSDRVYVDATEGGVFIEGTQVISLSQAMQDYCGVEYDIGGIVKRIMLNSKLLKKGDMVRLRNFLHSNRESCKELLDNLYPVLLETLYELKSIEEIDFSFAYQLIETHYKRYRMLDLVTKKFLYESLVFETENADIREKTECYRTFMVLVNSFLRHVDYNIHVLKAIDLR